MVEGTESKKFRRISGINARLGTVLGAQWGDEGKGKLVDILAEKYDVVARFNGGANAGHTLVVDGKKFAFHLLPCGMLYPGKLNVVGNGVVLHVPTLMEELKSLEDAKVDTKKNLIISNRCHLLFDFHKMIDGAQENRRGKDKIGTTKRGIGPCYASKMTRNSVRAGELLDWDHFKERYLGQLEALQTMYPKTLEGYDAEEELSRFREYKESIGSMIQDTVLLLNDWYKEGKHILAEGANAALLDIDFGTYPAVTSSSTTAGGVSTGTGLAPMKLESIVGVVKAYTTRVGKGPFPTELLEGDVDGDKMCSVGREFGTTTGRRRRCGWLDIPLVQYSTLVNDYTSLNITKLDILNGFETIKIGVAYKIDGKKLPAGAMPCTLKELEKVEVEYIEMPGWTTDISTCTCWDQLPDEAKDYIRKIEKLTEVPVSWIGVGPGRDQMLQRYVGESYPKSPAIDQVGDMGTRLAGAAAE